MSDFITDNVTVEGTVSGQTIFNSGNINTSILSATTLYGNGSNLTNVSASVTLTNPITSIQFNNNNILSGVTNFEYIDNGQTLDFSGNTYLHGNFFLTNSSSVKIKLQWFGALAAGTSPGIIWTNMPTGVATTWRHTTSGSLTGDATYICDLSEYTECRFYFSKQVAGAANSTLRVQNSLDNSVWMDLVQNPVGTGTGAVDSGWVTIPVSARTFNYIRLVGGGGTATASPRFSPPILLIR